MVRSPVTRTISNSASVGPPSSRSSIEPSNKTKSPSISSTPGEVPGASVPPDSTKTVPDTAPASDAKPIPPLPNMRAPSSTNKSIACGIISAPNSFSINEPFRNTSVCPSSKLPVTNSTFSSILKLARLSMPLLTIPFGTKN